MSAYDHIRSLIEEKPAKKAIKAKYKGEANPRELWPHVLGKNSTSGYEVVLCYQGAGPDPNQGYRCFKVEDLELVDVPYEPQDWSPKKKFKLKDVMRQNCVSWEEVDAYR